MAKTISERLREKQRSKKMSKKAQNRAAFLSLRQEIKDALDDGWSMLEIWEDLHEEKKIDFSYQVLRRLTNSLILKKQTGQTAKAPVEPIPPSQTKSNDEATGEKDPQMESKSTIGGFKFTTNLKKEDLI